jgi:hypothetical protein
MKLFVVQFSHPPVIPSLFGSNFCSASCSQTPSVCEQCGLLGCDAVLLLHKTTLRRKLSPPPLVTANVPSSQTLFTLMMEAMRSSETSIHSRATRLHIPEDGILNSHRRENLISNTLSLRSTLNIRDKISNP